MTTLTKQSKVDASVGFSSSDFLTGTQSAQTDALSRLLDNLSSNDPKAIANDALRSGGVQPVLSELVSVVRVLSDYAHLRNQNPDASLYADDRDLASSLNLVAETLSVCRSALPIEASSIKSTCKHE